MTLHSHSSFWMAESSFYIYLYVCTWIYDRKKNKKAKVEAEFKAFLAQREGKQAAESSEGEQKVILSLSISLSLSLYICFFPFYIHYMCLYVSVDCC